MVKPTPLTSSAGDSFQVTANHTGGIQLSPQHLHELKSENKILEFLHWFIQIYLE